MMGSVSRVPRLRIPPMDINFDGAGVALAAFEKTEKNLHVMPEFVLILDLYVRGIIRGYTPSRAIRVGVRVEIVRVWREAVDMEYDILHDVDRNHPRSI